VLHPNAFWVSALSPSGVSAPLFSIDAPTNIRDFRDRTWPVRLGDRSTLLASTYFPGNNRHKGFDKIVADLRNLLALDF
jgi:hypothetical protein